MQLFIASGVCLCTDGLEDKTVCWSEFSLFSSLYLFPNLTPINEAILRSPAPREPLWRNGTNTNAHTLLHLCRQPTNTCLCKPPTSYVLWQSLGKILDCMDFNFTGAEPFWARGLGSADRYSKVSEAWMSEILLLLWPQAEQSLLSPLFPNSTSLESVAPSASEDCC